jgi:hypothetical protein
VTGMLQNVPKSQHSNPMCTTPFPSSHVNSCLSLGYLTYISFTLIINAGIHMDSMYFQFVFLDQLHTLINDTSIFKLTFSTTSTGTVPIVALSPEISPPRYVMKAGGMATHHQFAPHRSSLNSSQNWRRVQIERGGVQSAKFSHHNPPTIFSRLTTEGRYIHLNPHLVVGGEDVGQR